MREQRARLRRLSIWFCVNLIIFVACYLNYRLLLKHRYLYRILNVGLCFSRAAAMIINFNLLLVWLPMCKYSLTRLAFHANNMLNRLKRQQQEAKKRNLCEVQPPALLEVPITKQNQYDLSQCYQFYKMREPTKLGAVHRKLKQSLTDASDQFRSWLCEAKLNSINGFLIVVDHSTSLHTICATTITIASVIHTVAHLMNVINFSKNFNPLLGNLNMAEYKGQNPFQLLVSVPGITGCLMVVILILMSLSSTDIIRNSSYDLFQIFHRLSIIFVFLLFLHPSSHVLKEQSNVDRHHPELCYVSEMTPLSLISNSTASALLHESHAKHSFVSWPHHTPSKQLAQAPVIAPSALTSVGSGHNKTVANQGHPNEPSATSLSTASSAAHQLHRDHFVNRNNNKTDLSNHDITAATASSQSNRSVPQLRAVISSNSNRNDKDHSISKVLSNLNEPCLDSEPLFVAQSSICWYVLSIGLSCYLFDLILRKWRRSKSSIELLDVQLDCEGNLIELILSSNHKRFSRWLPGQFVYLNCPQLAAYEWHPFTISSMDNGSRQFTLHIKTGGDWTRKLRDKLELRQASHMDPMSPPSCCLGLPSAETSHSPSTAGDGNHNGLAIAQRCSLNLMSPVHIGSILPSLESYNRIGQPQVECTKVARINCDNTGAKCENDLHGQLYSVVCNRPGKRPQEEDQKALDLYIDGPFHSPFERLLEQEVSVCIANGVGWTAFSSAFQCITNTYTNTSRSIGGRADDWWWKWRRFAISKPTDRLDSGLRQTKSASRFSETKLHIMVIVTSIEQLRPFYDLARNYFNQIQEECLLSGTTDPLNPVREISAFITRTTKEDDSIEKFCEQEKLLLFKTDQCDNPIIRVNEVFTIEFGKPQFERFLDAFNVIYPNSQKVSVYCCGSHQVKTSVKDICRRLNKANKSCHGRRWPVYSYHEENF